MKQRLRQNRPPGISLAAALLLLAALLVISSGCGTPTENPRKPSTPVPTAAVSSADSARMQVEYDRLVRDLHSLNLVNGLHLSREQMKMMLPLLEESARLEAAVQKAKDEEFPRFNQVLLEIRDRLEEHNDITDLLQKRLDAATLPIDKTLARKRDRKAELAEQVKVILNDNQRLMVRFYEPCMVPTPNVSHPERIGGVVDSEKFALELERLRKLPEDEYHKTRDRILAEKKMRMKVFNTDEQIRFVTGRMESAMDTARKLSDVEFEIRKSQLANVPLPQNPRKEVEREFTGRYVLNPYLLKVFKKKLEKDPSKLPATEE